MKKTLLTYGLKLSVAGLLLYFIFSHIHPGETAAALRAASPLYLLIAVAVQILCNTVASCRWRLIMERLGFHAPRLFYLRSYFKGLFFNQGLPSSIGGDGIRILDCSRIGSAKEAFFGVFIDRVVGLAGLLLLNIAALLMSHHLLPPQVEYPLLLILVALAVGLLMLFLLRKFAFFAQGKYLGFLGNLSERYFQVYSSPSAISLQLGLSVLIHLLSISAFFMNGLAVGLDFPLHVYLALVPPVVLLTILPVSLAGWGVREGAMVGFFMLVGADKTKVLAFSLLCGLTTLASSLPGLVIYLTQQGKPQAKEAEPISRQTSEQTRRRPRGKLDAGLEANSTQASE
ncbi:flippase-like domain-containing protein [Desulfobulbus sp. F1]|nr:flippase-like domain-containing protein [Desulfobulbus sp. F1]